MRRTAALWLSLFAVYAATIGLHAFGASQFGGDEPHYLLAAESLVRDGDLDVRNQYRARSYAAFYPYPLERQGRPRNGRLLEPHGAGYPALIAPAYAMGGATAVQLLAAALAALAVALGYRLALRAVPDPWALGAAVAVGLSPPLVAYGSAVYPELAAGAALAAAALLALRLDDRVRRREAFGCFALLGALPWLGTKFALAGLVVGAFAARSLFRSRRRTLAIGAIELALFSAALYVAVNEALYGGPTPYAAGASGESSTGASSLAAIPGRAYRLAALMIDRDYGLLRWAPFFALAFAGIWLLARSKREHLARALPERAAAERAALLCSAVLGAQLLVAAFLAPTMFGFWFPPRHLLAALPLAIPLCALGLRRLPRTGLALAALTLVASGWLYVDVRLGSGGLVGPRPDAPFGPLTAAFPLYGAGWWPYALSAALGLALAALVAFEARHWRQTAGATLRRYSG